MQIQELIRELRNIEREHGPDVWVQFGYSCMEGEQVSAVEFVEDCVVIE